MLKLFLALALIALAGCADVEILPQPMTGHTYGFWFGLWHGLIILFSFFGQLLWEDIAVYAINNNGGWYDFDFCLGIGAFTSGAAARS